MSDGSYESDSWNRIQLCMKEYPLRLSDRSDRSDASDSSYFWLDTIIEISKLCLTVNAKFYHLPVG